MAFHIRNALAERLEREKSRMASAATAGMQEIWARLSLVSNRDPRTDDEILGYGLDGLPN